MSLREPWIARKMRWKSSWFECHGFNEFGGHVSEAEQILVSVSGKAATSVHKVSLRPALIGVSCFDKHSFFQNRIFLSAASVWTGTLTILKVLIFTIVCDTYKLDLFPHLLLIWGSILGYSVDSKVALVVSAPISAENSSIPIVGFIL